MSRSIYLITGPSGSGKTVLADYLTEAGYTAIDADGTPGLCYYVNKNNKPVPYPQGADAGWWASHNYIWELDRLSRLLDTLEPTDKPIFFCGNAGNIKKAWDMFAGVFYLDAPGDTLIARNADPKRKNSPGHRIDEPAQLLEWAEPFKAHMLELGAITIDASPAPADIAKTILAQIAGKSAKA